MIVRGQGDDLYTECYAGSLSLSETIATGNCTGTLAKTAGSTAIVGTGTAFLSEIGIGEFVWASTELLVVEAVTDNTHFVAAKPVITSVSGITGVRLPIMFELNKKRGTLLWGNALIFDKGTILCVGNGVLRINGAVLPGTSLTAGPIAQIAIYNPTAGTYAVYTLGMPTPTAPTVAEVAGGVKKMPIQNYSIRIAPGRLATNGYNNPSLRASQAITVVGNQFEVDMTGIAFDSASGNDIWKVYGTLSTAVSPALGPHYFIKNITAADITANKFKIEWLDPEIQFNDLLTFDNDAPVAAEFISSLQGFPVYVSCQGQGNAAAVNGTAPGPFVIPAKPNNIEAAPLGLAVSLSPPETIVGHLSAQGRIFLLTPNTLQFAQLTNIDAAPVTTRSYWRSGFKNPYQLCFVNGQLFGFTTQGPTRSTAGAEVANEEHEFAAAVRSITTTWIPANVLVSYDPENNAVCFFHAADSLNSGNFWTTRVLMYGLQQGQWIGDVLISDLTRDMIVSGVATVSDNLDFLAGGRLGGGIQVDTWRFDVVSGVPVSYYQAWPLTDAGVETRDKTVKSVKFLGNTTSGSIGIFGSGATQALPLAALDTTNSASLTGAIPIPNAATVTQTKRIPLNVPNLGEFTFRIEGTFTGTAPRDQIHEVVYESAVSGVRR